MVFTRFACWLSLHSKAVPDLCLTGSAVALSSGSARERLLPIHVELAQGLSLLAQSGLIQLLSDLPPKADRRDDLGSAQHAISAPSTASG
jgi:hypothetical protein